MAPGALTLIHGQVGDDGGVEHLLAQLVQHLLPVVLEIALHLVDRLQKEEIKISDYK